MRYEKSDYSVQKENRELRHRLMEVARTHDKIAAENKELLERFKELLERIKELNALTAFLSDGV